MIIAAHSGLTDTALLLSSNSLLVGSADVMEIDEAQFDILLSSGVIGEFNSRTGLIIDWYEEEWISGADLDTFVRLLSDAVVKNQGDDLLVRIRDFCAVAARRDVPVVMAF